MLFDLNSAIVTAINGNAVAMHCTLDYVVWLLPVVIPVAVTFIGLRKGIGFLQKILHSA